MANSCRRGLSSFSRVQISSSLFRFVWFLVHDWGLPTNVEKWLITPPLNNQGVVNNVFQWIMKRIFMCDWFLLDYVLVVVLCLLASCVLFLSFTFIYFHFISFHFTPFPFISSYLFSAHFIASRFISSLSFTFISFHFINYPRSCRFRRSHGSVLECGSVAKEIRERIKGGERKIKGKAKESPKSMSGWNSWLAVLHHWGHQ